MTITNWNSSYTPSEQYVDSSEYFRLAMIIINSVVAFLATSLNFLIIYAFVKTASLCETPSNVLVLGLAIADFSAGVIAQPVFVSYEIYNLVHEEFDNCEKSPLACDIFLAITEMVILVSFLNIIAITADRFLAVYLHLRYRELVTTKRYSIALACIWIFCLALVTITSVHDFHEGHIALLTLYFAFGIINIILLVKISRVVQRHSVQIQAQQQSVQHAIDMPKYKKSVKTMYYIVGAFLFSFLSSVAFIILELFFDDIWNRNERFLDGGSWTLVMLNSVLNPIIYCLRVGDVRNAIGRLLRRSSVQQQPTEP